ncbi:MAG TPA: response regulator [Polyangia bacterium]|jgi:CheY-like chemotaxis protein
MPRDQRPILVVDDDPDLRGLLELILQQEGYRVIAAGDGAEALARAAATPPALIFLDMRMPVMDGWEFARELRARYGRSTPIVVVTAAEDAAARARDIDADAWLGKPFEIADVTRTAARLLG